MERICNSVIRSTIDEKTDAASNNKMFKRLQQLNDILYEKEFVKTEIEHKKHIIVGFFVLQYAKPGVLEL